MPATTPRGYPYSIPGDPAKVPRALQSLAEAIDTDVQNVAATVAPRPAFRVSSVSTQSISTWTTFTLSRFLPFDTVDFSVGGALGALGTTTDIVPQLPGFYWVEASITLPREGGTVLDLMNLRLQNATETLTSSSVHLPAASADGGQNLQVQTGAYFNGTTDYVRAVLTTHASSSSPGRYSFRGRYLTMTRMTES